MLEGRRNKIHSVATARQLDLTIVLENIHDPHNIAAVLRTCDAVGIQEVYVVNSENEKPSKWSRRSSAGTNKWVDVHYYRDPQSCLEVVKNKYEFIYATHLGEKSSSLYELDLSQSVALAFGNEHNGLSGDILKHCTGNFVIPMMGMIQSLNISVACAITLYEAARQRLQLGFYEQVFPEREHEKIRDKWLLRELRK